jgi:hypothetical protein
MEQLLVHYLLLILHVVQGTDIKWTAGDSSGSDAAKAPRSQKYWDEHGIERPDYAKTDAELAAERGDSSQGVQYLYVIAFLLTGVGAFLYFRHARAVPVGTRLGSTEGGPRFLLHILESEEDALEKARKARLERFEANAEKQD